jgi:uncharacterized protein (TIRG00374 family)
MRVISQKSPQSRTGLKLTMSLLLKLSVTTVLVGVIVWLGGVTDVIGIMGRMHPGYIALVLLVNTADRALMTFKWIQLLRSRGMDLPFLHAMRIYCASMVWGTFLPATVGADVVRAFSTSRIGLDSNVVVSSIIIERMVGFLSALLLGLISLVLLSLSGSLDPRLRVAWFVGTPLLIGATSVFALSFNKRAFKWLESRLFYRWRENRLMLRFRHFYGIYRAYRDDKKILAVFFALTMGEQLLPILHLWLIAWGLGIEVSLLYVAGAVPLSMLISRIPVSIDGLGVFEGTFILLISLAGVSAPEAVAIAFMGRILETASWLPWWLAHVLQTKEFKVPRAAQTVRR